MASLLLAAPDAHAGTYSGPIYSGGLTTDGTNTNPYTTGGLGWTGGIGGACSAHGGGSTTLGLSNSGKITAVFTWQPAYPGEVPPANVIVYQHCIAHWGGGTYNSGGSVSGACDNGLKGSVVASPPDPRGGVGASCDSVTYSVQSPGGDGSVTVTCSPSSSLNGSAGSGFAQGTCSVEYGASISPVIITLGDTTLDSSNNQNILIGQGCTPSITAEGYTLSNFQWNPGGSVFDQFLIASDQSSGYATFLSSDALTQPSPLWHYLQDSNGSPVSVTCSATASVNGTAIGTVTGQKSLTVWAPFYYMNHNAGPTGIQNSLVYTGNGDNGGGPGSVPGMRFIGAVGTPAMFCNTGNTGSWLFVQLANIYEREYYQSTFVPLTNSSGGLALDNGWPYTPGWPADNLANSDYSTPQDASDSPDLTLEDNVNQFIINDSFQMYMMYIPPGNNSQYVPLHKLVWEWNTPGSLPYDDGPWPDGASGTVTVDSDARCTVHPSWTIKYVNPH